MSEHFFTRGLGGSGHLPPRDVLRRKILGDPNLPEPMAGSPAPSREPKAEEARLFPIQQGESIPWAAAEKAYVTYARLFGTQQSLERLAERQGFSVQEWACLYLGHDPGQHRWLRHEGGSLVVEPACIQKASTLAALAALPPSGDAPTGGLGKVVARLIVEADAAAKASEGFHAQDPDECTYAIYQGEALGLRRAVEMLGDPRWMGERTWKQSPLLDEYARRVEVEGGTEALPNWSQVGDAPHETLKEAARALHAYIEAHETYESKEDSSVSLWLLPSKDYLEFERLTDALGAALSASVAVGEDAGTPSAYAHTRGSGTAFTVYPAGSLPEAGTPSEELREAAHKIMQMRDHDVTATDRDDLHDAEEWDDAYNELRKALARTEGTTR